MHFGSLSVLHQTLYFAGDYTPLNPHGVCDLLLRVAGHPQFINAAALLFAPLPLNVGQVAGHAAAGNGKHVRNGGLVESCTSAVQPDGGLFLVGLIHLNAMCRIALDCQCVDLGFAGRDGHGHIDRLRFSLAVCGPEVEAVDQDVVLIDFDRWQHLDVFGVTLDGCRIRLEAGIQVFAVENVANLS